VHFADKRRLARHSDRRLRAEPAHIHRREQADVDVELAHEARVQAEQRLQEALLDAAQQRGSQRCRRFPSLVNGARRVVGDARHRQRQRHQRVLERGERQFGRRAQVHDIGLHQHRKHHLCIDYALHHELAGLARQQAPQRVAVERAS
jgi:hypothetical protein